MSAGPQHEECFVSTIDIGGQEGPVPMIKGEKPSQETVHKLKQEVT